jgi:hypothetical protein
VGGVLFSLKDACASDFLLCFAIKVGRGSTGYVFFLVRAVSFFINNTLKLLFLLVFFKKSAWILGKWVEGLVIVLLVIKT